MIKVIYCEKFEFISLEGMITEIDLENKKQIKIVNKIIPIQNIVNIDMDYPQEVKKEIDDWLDEIGADDNVVRIYR